MTVYQASRKQAQLSSYNSQSNITSGQNTERGFSFMCAIQIKGRNIHIITKEEQTLR